MNINELLKSHRVIPVLTENDPAIAVKLVAAMIVGGLTCVEVALRTPNALEVIKTLGQEFSGLCVGAGTLRTPGDFSQVQKAGAKFAVSPGASLELLAEAENWDLPYLPAAASVSEIMSLQARGYSAVKLFPAEQLGGVGFIKAVSGPLPDMTFVPSGGVDLKNARDYLALPQVAAVSGSWMLNKTSVAAKDWPAIAEVSAESAKLITSQLNA